MVADINDDDDDVVRITNHKQVRRFFTYNFDSFFSLFAFFFLNFFKKEKEAMNRRKNTVQSFSFCIFFFFWLFEKQTNAHEFTTDKRMARNAADCTVYSTAFSRKLTIRKTKII